MTLAMHPEAVPDDPATLRWVVPAEAVPFIGPVGVAPGPLGDLLADGTLASVNCESAGVVITLSGGGSWREFGENVRSALQEALADPGGWSPACDDGAGRAIDLASSPPRHDPDADNGDDTSLATAARAALAGSAGDYVRSHGGTVDLVDVRDGVALVRLTGACSGCPASAMTIHGHLERDLLKDIPGLTAVRQAPTRLTLLRSLRLSRSGGS